MGMQQNLEFEIQQLKISLYVLKNVKDGEENS